MECVYVEKTWKVLVLYLLLNNSYLNILEKQDQPEKQNDRYEDCYIYKENDLALNSSIHWKVIRQSENQMEFHLLWIT